MQKNERIEVPQLAEEWEVPVFLKKLDSLDSFTDFDNPEWGSKIDNFLIELERFLALALAPFEKEAVTRTQDIIFLSHLRSIDNFLGNLKEIEFSFESIKDAKLREIIKSLLFLRLKLTLPQENIDFIGADQSFLPEYQDIVSQILGCSIADLNLKNMGQTLKYNRFLYLLLAEATDSLKQLNSLSLATNN